MLRKKRHLFLIGYFITLFLYAHPPQSVKLPLETDPEILLANRYLKKAGIFHESAAYDSSVFYLKYAATIYKKKISWEKYIDVLISIGKEYFVLGKFDNSIIYLKQALDAGLHFDFQAFTATAYSGLGVCYHFQGDYTRAATFHRKALIIREKFFGVNHSETVTSYNNLGGCYLEEGDFIQAINYFQKTLSIWLRAPVPNQPDLAMVYNNLGLCYLRSGEYNKAILFSKKALEGRLKSFGQEHPEAASSYENLGLCYEKKGNYTKSLTLLRKALAVRLKVFGPDHPDIALSYNNLASCYQRQGDYAKAILFSKKALAVRLKIFEPDHPDVAMSYNNIGMWYQDQGDYSKATLWIQKGLAINLKVFDSNHSYVAVSYNNLGLCYEGQGNYSKSLSYHQKALAIKLKVLGLNHSDVASSYNNLGLCYEGQGNYSKSLLYHQKALTAWLKTLGRNHPFIAVSYNNIGLCHYFRGEYSKALLYHQKALAIRLRSFGDNHPKVARSYNNIGLVHEKKIDYDSALYFHQKALATLVKGFKNQNIYQNPSLYQINSKTIMLKVLIRKAVVFQNRYKKQPHDIKDIQMAFQTYSLTTDLIDSMRNDHTSVETKKALTENAADVYENAIRTAFELHRITGNEDYLNEAFLLAEKSKSFLLLHALRDSKAKSFAGIPDSLIENESDLKISIAFYEKKQFEAEQKKDSAKISMYQNELFDKKNAFEKLIKKLETDFPDYYRLKYDNNISSVKAVQAKLPQQSALLEYLVGDSSVFMFTITKSNLQVDQIQKPRDFDALHTNFRRGLTDYNLLTQNPALADSLYLSSASQLYDLLLKKAVEKLPSTTKRLLIVPDGKLGYLPFGVLLNKSVSLSKSDYRKLPYLIRDYSVGYAFSAAVWAGNIEKKATKRPEKQFAGFAPQYKKSDFLTQDTLDQSKPTALLVRSGELPLPNALKEVNFLAELTGGEAFTGNAATETAFKQKAAGYAVLHLAMHSLIDDRNPQYSRMLFSPGTDSTDDGFLNAAELYNMRLNAEMVVLSACETGYGEIIRGEGIACLSRAFAYAGVPSITASYWKVPDASTSPLMISFYQNLAKGELKDEALRNAKLNYLNTTTDPLFSHPFFWAAFVPVGDMRPVQMNENNRFIWWMTGVLILIIGMACFLVIRIKK